ncbi:DUF4333 domain-containing protein [Luteipulveratus mongoliensis]|uniref:DUF4333 domain-containing protein n=1 Tax=Luteipulveratus mongoliensis TaxID=571913 RepID=A0A0K1JL46_9MICO|nr:DUF4333 domain-containing protein [Luteipulveratus mongoliensis]AKU17449.1 hypothetical protein VV02_19030 [Luteipulveratus mongoliensis]
MSDLTPPNADPYAAPDGATRVPADTSRTPVPPSSWPTGHAAAWSPAAPPAPSSSNGLAIAAIVLSGVSLLIVLGAGFLVFLGVAFATGFDEWDGPMDGGPALHGTAAQVVDGQPYDGARLAGEVARIYEDQNWSPEGFTCDEVSSVAPGATSECRGDMDGDSIHVSVEFEDAQGHFVVRDDFGVSGG